MASFTHCNSTTSYTPMASASTSNDVRGRYRYKSQLERGEIRLLRFQERRCKDDLLSFEFSVTALQQHQSDSRPLPEEYFSLSYVWGDQRRELMEEILIDDIQFQVGPNLATALAYLEGRIDHPIWIDAICINQSDNKEKNRQVQQMSDIYRHSERTLIWLGEGNEQVEYMLRKLDVVGRRAKATGLNELNASDMATWPAFENSESGSARRKLEIKIEIDVVISDLKTQRLDFSESDFETLVELSKRPWFHRVWIIQELCVPRNLEFMCGTKSIDGENFIAGFTMINLWTATEFKPLAELPHSFFLSGTWQDGSPIRQVLLRAVAGEPVLPSGRASTTLGTRKKLKTGMNLKRLLVSSFSLNSGGTLDSTEPKDRIYALLGISSDRDDINIQPQYDGTVSHQEVYADVAKRLLQHGHLDVLSLCRPLSGDSDRDPALPSWAPDWTIPLRAAWGQFSEDKLYDASKGDLFCLRLIDTYPPLFGTVQLEGFFVDKVGALLNPGILADGSQADSSERNLVTFRCVKLFLDNASSRYTDNERLEGVWRIPIADREFNDIGLIVRASKKSFQEYNYITSLYEGDPDVLHLGVGVSYFGKLEALQDGMPFISDSRYVGLCPNIARREDEIWIPRGAHVPYLFRRTEEGHHKLIGETYVYGIMDGEFIRDSPPCGVLTLV
jgi:hypothetical protein